jgi:hypothetical protein
VFKVFNLSILIIYLLDLPMQFAPQMCDRIVTALGQLLAGKVKRNSREPVDFVEIQRNRMGIVLTN